mmetsp:Transcript_45303/g.144599  ORF Transcript_45303/g.144599 Transcript_45303/m.144599 type:complete len:138 (+) Transcript_45303:572-985(+)
MDRMISLHSSWHLAPAEIDANPAPPERRDLLAVFTGSSDTKPHLRMPLVTGLGLCGDCEALYWSRASPPHRALLGQALTPLLRRAKFSIVPPGDALDRASRDQSIGMGAVPVWFDVAPGSGTKIQHSFFRLGSHSAH